MKRIAVIAGLMFVLALSLCACSSGSSDDSSSVQTIDGYDYQTMTFNNESTLVPLRWTVLKNEGMNASPSDGQYPVVIISDNSKCVGPIAQTCESADEFQEMVEDEMEYLGDSMYEFEEPEYTTDDGYPYKAEVKYTYRSVEGTMVFLSNETTNAWLTTACEGGDAQGYEDQLAMAIDKFTLK